MAAPGNSSPYDTVVSATLRFLVEVAAWVMGPWAAIELGWGWPVAVAVAVVLVALPAVFSTPGDKKQILVATPGPARILIELSLIVVAIVAGGVVLPTVAAYAIAALGAAAIVANWPRFRWLAAGARSPSTS